MKIIFACFLTSLFAFSSCSKDSTKPTTPATPTYPVEGLWIGTFTVNNNPSQSGTYFYSYAVYTDGSIIVKSIPADGNTYYSAGKWALSNTNVFSATFTSMNFNGPQVTQTITANFSNIGEMTDGTWTDKINASQAGTLSMKRVN